MHVTMTGDDGRWALFVEVVGEAGRAGLAGDERAATMMMGGWQFWQR